MSVIAVSPSVSYQSEGAADFDSSWTRLLAQVTSSLSGSIYAPRWAASRSGPYAAISRVERRLSRSPLAMDRAFDRSAQDFVEILASIIPPVSPTIQVAIDEDGTIEGTWLVHQNELTLSLSLDRSGFILAVADDGSILIDEDFSLESDPPSARAFRTASRFLATLGEKVEARVGG